MKKQIVRLLTLMLVMVLAASPMHATGFAQTGEADGWTADELAILREGAQSLLEWSEELYGYAENFQAGISAGDSIGMEFAASNAEKANECTGRMAGKINELAPYIRNNPDLIWVSEEQEALLLTETFAAVIEIVKEMQNRNISKNHSAETAEEYFLLAALLEVVCLGLDWVAEGGRTFEVGDINQDGAVDAADALRALQHSVQLISLNESMFAVADVTRDQKVDASDALRILQYTVKLVDSFPAAEEYPIPEVPFPSDSLPEEPEDPGQLDTTNRYTVTVQGDNSDPSLLQAVAAFQEKHDNVTIRLQSGDQGRITSLDHLKLQLASNNAPDVVIMDSVYTAAAGYDGYLIDLQQFGSADVKDQFVSSCWEAVRSQLEGQDAQFGLPLDCSTMLMFYNKTLLDKAGVTFAPNTWAQFTEALDLLRAVPGVTTPFHLMVNFNDTLDQKSSTAFQWMTYLWRSGGDVLTSDLKQAAFQGDEGVRALQMYVDMVAKYGVSNGAYSEGDPFGTGAAGFDMMTQNFYKDYMGNPNRTDTYGAAMLPELVFGIPRYSGLGLSAMALPNKIASARGDALTTAVETAKWAYEFAEFYATGLDYQLEYGKSSYQMPSLKAGEGQGVFQGDYWNIAYRQLETSKYRPGVKNWDAIESAISDAIDNAVNGIRPAHEALAGAAAQVNRLLS